MNARFHQKLFVCPYEVLTTSNVYSHVDSESKKMSAKAIEQALAENEPGKEGA